MGEIVLRIALGSVCGLGRLRRLLGLSWSRIGASGSTRKSHYCMNTTCHCNCWKLNHQDMARMSALCIGMPTLTEILTYTGHAPPKNPISLYFGAGEHDFPVLWRRRERFPCTLAQESTNFPVLWRRRAPELRFFLLIRHTCTSNVLADLITNNLVMKLTGSRLLTGLS